MFTRMPARADRTRGGTVMTSPVPISEAADVMRLLGDPLRPQIVEILARGPACVCHLAEDTGGKQPNISGHLRLLRQAGLVVAEPQWRYTYYRLVPDAL